MLGIPELGFVVDSKVIEDEGTAVGEFEVGFVVGSSEEMLGNVLGEKEGRELLLTCKNLCI